MKIPKLYRMQNIGFIGSYFTEQILQRDFKVKLLEKGDCERSVLDSKLTVAFVDVDFFNKDNSWHDFDVKEIIEYLEDIGLNVVLITYCGKIIDERYLHIFIGNNRVETSNSTFITIPYLINENLFNPIKAKKKNDLLILNDSMEEIEAENFLGAKVYHYINVEKPQYEMANISDLSKNNLLQLVRKIKESKVVYVPKPSQVNSIILRYIELFCAAQNTFMITKEDINDMRMYSISSIDDTTLYYYIKSYNQQGLLNDHILLKNNREVFLKNSLIQYNNLVEIFNNGIVMKEDIEISVVTSTIRKKYIKKFIDQMNSQNYVMIEVLLLTHGFKLNDEEKIDLQNYSVHPITFLEKDSKVVYGNCLNSCIDEMSFKYFAKVDDDDYYFPNYLIDSWIALKYSGASIVGKHSTFWHLKSENLVAERFITQSNKYTEYIAGATLFSESEFIREYKFSPLASGIDRELLSRINYGKHKIYCNSPYEFCVYRDSDVEAHTWKIDNLYLLRSAKIRFMGAPNNSLTVLNNK